jgi:hypothetical protein
MEIEISRMIHKSLLNSLTSFIINERIGNIIREGYI